MRLNSGSAVTRYTSDLPCKSPPLIAFQQYTNLSKYGYGVAFLSESKYGFVCEGNILHISLLRAATGPDAEQDQGESFTLRSRLAMAYIVPDLYVGKHEFSWGVMPHVGSFLESDVPMAAYVFNSPLHRA